MQVAIAARRTLAPSSARSRRSTARSAASKHWGRDCATIGMHVWQSCGDARLLKKTQQRQQCTARARHKICCFTRRASLPAGQQGAEDRSAVPLIIIASLCPVSRRLSVRLTDTSAGSTDRCTAFWQPGSADVGRLPCGLLTLQRSSAGGPEHALLSPAPSGDPTMGQCSLRSHTGVCTGASKLVRGLREPSSAWGASSSAQRPRRAGQPDVQHDAGAAGLLDRQLRGVGALAAGPAQPRLRSSGTRRGAARHDPCTGRVSTCYLLLQQQQCALSSC